MAPSLALSGALIGFMACNYSAHVCWITRTLAAQPSRACSVQVFNAYHPDGRPGRFRSETTLGFRIDSYTREQNARSTNNPPAFLYHMATRLRQ
jgi:hypothetical protein